MVTTSDERPAARSTLRQSLLASAAAALALHPTEALANCAFELEIKFSYPSEETRQVPLDAVFWAVPDDGSVSFRLDGVELQHLDDSDEGRVQFVPSEKLSPGMHDIEISVSGTWEGEAVQGETLRLQVEAVEQAPVEADATIEAVSYFPVIVDGEVHYPTPEETGLGCSLTPLHPATCYDLIPWSATRIEFSARGNAIGYLSGGSVMAPGCRVYFPYEFVAGVDAPYSIRPILPTGLGAPRVFEGEPTGLENIPPLPTNEQTSPAPPARVPEWQPAPAADSCALHVPASGASSPSWLCFAAAGALAVRLRRR